MESIARYPRCYAKSLSYPLQVALIAANSNGLGGLNMIDPRDFSGSCTRHKTDRLDETFIIKSKASKIILTAKQLIVDPIIRQAYLSIDTVDR